jgi:hypothetical protein
MKTPEQLMAEIKYKRGELLAESDILVMPDKWDMYTQEQKNAWTVYRQALRDLPSIVDVNNPVYPVRPI